MICLIVGKTECFVYVWNVVSWAWPSQTTLGNLHKDETVSEFRQGVWTQWVYLSLCPIWIKNVVSKIVTFSKEARSSHLWSILRSDNFEMSFWYLQFPPKNERKQVDLRFHSSKIEFVRFLEETSTYKNHFDFFWPLVCSIYGV